MFNPVLLVVLGTAACGGGMLFERRRRTVVESLTRRLARRNPADSEPDVALDRRLLAHVRDGVRVLGIDVDGSGGYAMHPALSGDPDHWSPGTFHHLALPGPDLRAHQLSGRLEGFDAMNPNALVGIDGLENAAGGVRGLGWLATRTERDRLAMAIRGALNGLGRGTRDLFRDGDTVRIRLVAGLFGGFGSGALDPVEEVVQDCAMDMFPDPKAWDLRIVLLVPGRHRGKDADNSRAITCGVLLERAAQASGWRHRVVYHGGEARVRRVQPVPVALLSDENAAATPAVLSLQDFNGALSDALWAELVTPVGEKLIARVSDLDTASAEVTDLGEPLRARSVGLSVIDLPVERIGRYCEASLGAAALGHLLQEVGDEQVDALSVAFFKAEQLLEGQGITDLSSRLLGGGPAEPSLDDVVIQRFRRASDDLKGMALLGEAGARMDLVVRQVDPGDAIARHTGRVSEAVAARLSADVRRLCRDPEKGFAAARQYLDHTAARAGHVAEKAAADTAEREERLRAAETRVNHWEEHFTPGVREMSALVRWAKRDQIETAATRYRRDLEHKAIARVQLLANQSAVRTLEATREAAERLLRDVGQAIDTLSEIRTKVDGERRRIADLPPGATCAVGLSLVQGEGDLDAYYRRFLGDRGEVGALRDVATRLLNEDDPVGSATNRSEVERILSEHVAETFRAKLAELHVVDELVRRYPDPADLCELLRERGDREAAERLPLKDGTDHIYKERRVAIAGLDLARGGALRDLLDRRPDAERVPYEVVDVRDRERIVFLRVRGAFPFSAWSHLEGFRESYERVTADSPYERLHVHPLERYYPWPGRGLTALDAAVIVAKAWALGRLELGATPGELQLVRGDGDLGLNASNLITYRVDPATRQQASLGVNLDSLTAPQNNGRKAYGIAVDVASLFSCAVRFFGAEPVELALDALRPPKPGAPPALEAAVASVVTDEAIARVRAELEWWRQNTVATTRVRARGERVLRGVA